MLKRKTLEGDNILEMESNVSTTFYKLPLLDYFVSLNVGAFLRLGSISLSSKLASRRR